MSPVPFHFFCPSPFFARFLLPLFLFSILLAPSVLYLRSYFIHLSSPFFHFVCSQFLSLPLSPIPLPRPPYSHICLPSSCLPLSFPCNRCIFICLIHFISIPHPGSFSSTVGATSGDTCIACNIGISLGHSAFLPLCFLLWCPSRSTFKKMTTLHPIFGSPRLCLQPLRPMSVPSLT